MAKTGRPPIYSRELADAFLSRLERGDKVMEICAESGMPSWATIVKWKRTKPEFAAVYARMRQASAEALEHLAIEEAGKATDKDSAAAGRLRVDTLKWAAAKRDPAKYADKLLHTGGDGEGPVQHEIKLNYALLETDELIELRRLLDKATPRRVAGPVVDGEAEEVGDE